jgi:two-component system NtrC family sensor kinase
MKLRLLIVILLVAALFSGVVLWRVDRFLYGDRMAWAEAQARSQVSSMIQAIRVEIQSGRRMLSTVNADTFKPTLTNWKSFQPYYAVALMTSQNGVMGISKMITRSDSPAANWTAVQLGQYIGFMGKELDSRGTVLLRSFKDPKKNTHVAVIYAGGGHAYILVGSGGNLQTLIESQKGSISSFAIVASDGLTISHAVPEYIGTVMGDSTLLKEIRATGSAQGLGTYLQGKKQVFGMYEQVPGSSAYVISTVPMDDLVKGRLSLAWQFVFLAVGFGLIGAAGYVWYEKRNPRGAPAAVSAPARPTQEVLPPIPSVSMQNVVTPPPSMSGRDVITSNASLIAPIAPKSAPPSPGTFTSRGESVPAPAMPPDWQQEKAEAYRQVAAAMGQEMRAPLASILGFSQMVLSKTQEPEVVQAVESILREARSSRDVLEKLVTFSGERRSPKSEAKIEGPLVQALKILDSRIQLKGIQVEKDFQDTRPWLMASEDLVKVFESFIENAIEGMERMQNKILKISTSESEAGLHVRIVDTGEGIER